MVDYNASRLIIPLLISATRDPRGEIPASIMNIATAQSGSVTVYLMRALRHLRNPPDWETWIAEGQPNTNNPSGESIVGTTVQSSWIK